MLARKQEGGHNHEHEESCRQAYCDLEQRLLQTSARFILAASHITAEDATQAAAPALEQDGGYQCDGEYDQRNIDVSLHNICP